MRSPRRRQRRGDEREVAEELLHLGARRVVEERLLDHHSIPLNTTPLKSVAAATFTAVIPNRPTLAK